MVDQRVDDILAGCATFPEEIGTLTKELKAALHFATARNLLGVGLNLCPGDVWMHQQLVGRPASYHRRTLPPQYCSGQENRWSKWPMHIHVQVAPSP